MRVYPLALLPNFPICTQVSSGKKGTPDASSVPTDVRSITNGFFIRGCLELPIIGSKEPFLLGLWACVNGEIYDEISESWQLEGREKTRGPYRGRLSNSLSVYPETLNLKIRIEIQPVGIRPLFLLQEHEHQLAIEQHSGITPGRAVELACLLLHQQRGGIDFEQKITRQSHST